MRKVTPLALAFAAVACGQFVPDDSTRLSYPIPAFSRTGEREIEVRDVYIDTFGKKGQPIKRRLLVVFDAVSSYFLFRYQGLGAVGEAAERDNRLILSDSDRIMMRY